MKPNTHASTAYREDDPAGGMHIKTELGTTIQLYLEVEGLSQAKFAQISEVDQHTISYLLAGKQSRVHETTLQKLACAMNMPEETLRLKSRIPASPLPERLKEHLPPFLHARIGREEALTDSVRAIRRQQIGKLIYRLLQNVVLESNQEERQILADLILKINRFQVQEVLEEEDWLFVKRIEEAYPLTKHSVP